MRMPIKKSTNGSLTLAMVLTGMCFDTTTFLQHLPVAVTQES
jgi:hypothetical protein